MTLFYRQKHSLCSPNVVFICLGRRNISSQGCFQDDPTDRDLNFDLQISSVTPKKCIDECRKAGYNYAGVQVSRA